MVCWEVMCQMMPQKKYEFLIRDAGIKEGILGPFTLIKNTFRNILDFVISKFQVHHVLWNWSLL